MTQYDEKEIREALNKVKAFINEKYSKNDKTGKAMITGADMLLNAIIWT